MAILNCLFTCYACFWAVMKPEKWMHVQNMRWITNVKNYKYISFPVLLYFKWPACLFCLPSAGTCQTHTSCQFLSKQSSCKMAQITADEWSWITKIKENIKLLQLKITVNISQEWIYPNYNYLFVSETTEYLIEFDVIAHFETHVH